MALDALAEVAGAALRLVGRIVLEVAVEWLVYGTGRALLWPFYRRRPPSENACLCTGIAAWALVVLAVVLRQKGLSA